MTNGSVEMPGLFCKRGRWTPGVPFILEKSCTISDTRIAARNYSTRALPTHLAYWPQLACRPPRLVSSPAAAPPAVDAPQLPSPQVPGRQASPLMQCIVQNYAEHKICGVYIHAEYKIMHGATLWIMQNYAECKITLSAILCRVQNYAEHKICGAYIHAEYKIMHSAKLCRVQKYAEYKIMQSAKFAECNCA